MFLLIHNNEFQRSKYLSIFQEITGRMYFISGSVQSYLNLKKINTELLQRIAVLEEEVQEYKKNWENLTDQIRPDSIHIDTDQTGYRYIAYARVINNQISGPNNYITLDKGSKHGITEDMAVISAKGIVGVIMRVSPHFSRVIPIINSGYHPSCMIKNTRFVGSLFWNGEDPRYISLIHLPSHTLYTIGDTIVTSGYSAVFPEGVPVGVVEGAFKQKNEEFNSLTVRLFTDFSTLNEVLIIRNLLREEQLKIEKGVGEE